MATGPTGGPVALVRRLVEGAHGQEERATGRHMGTRTRTSTNRKQKLAKSKNARRTVWAAGPHGVIAEIRVIGDNTCAKDSQ